MKKLNSQVSFEEKELVASKNTISMLSEILKAGDDKEIIPFIESLSKLKLDV